jgi:hypothetical protein
MFAEARPVFLERSYLARAAPGERRPTPRTRRGVQGRASGGRAATAAMASRRTVAGSSTRPATPTVARR